MRALVLDSCGTHSRSPETAPSSTHPILVRWHNTRPGFCEPSLHKPGLGSNINIVSGSAPGDKDTYQC